MFWKTYHVYQIMYLPFVNSEQSINDMIYIVLVEANNLLHKSNPIFSYYVMSHCTKKQNFSEHLEWFSLTNVVTEVYWIYYSNK